MKIAELRGKSKEELKDIVVSAKKEQFNLRMQVSTGSLENKSGFKEARKTVARAHTLIKEKELALLNEKPNATKAASKPAAKKTKKG